LPTILSTNELFVPPFENYFGHRNGMLWAEYLDTNGASGVKPPQYISDMIADINEFQTLVVGSPESDKLGAKLVKTMTENLLFIGTVAGPAPIYHRNELQNFPEFKTASYEYYRTYPYRPQQWFLAE
jgi:peptide/nickel transport system substrate-binding protein